MKPISARVLPWLAMLCLGLACEGERRAEQATPADATSKPGSEKAGADASGADAKSGADTKASADTKTNPGPDSKTTKPSKPVPPRAVVFYRAARSRVKLWALPEATAPDPAAARELGIVADDSGGSIYYGTSGPVLSGDGQWLAFLDEGRLEVVRLDGSARHRITKHRASRVEVLISGFSPDSSRLMFHQGEVQTEEGAALPKGVVQGFYELVLADRTLVPETRFEAFIAYADDGRHVIFQRTLPDRSSVLIRFDLDADTEEELQKTTEPFGFSQPVLHGDRIAYVRHPAEGKSQVAADALTGGKRIDLSPEGGFAQYQWPRISLDGRHVSYTDDTNLVVRTLDAEATRTLTTCSVRHCTHAWDSATTVVVLDGGKLSRVSLDGTTTPLASDVKGFVLAGAPG